MKKGKRRLLALLLVVMMVFQQSVLPAVSAETTTENATVAVQETTSQETKTTEAAAPETTEAAAPEIKTTEAKAPETTTEAKAQETTTEAKAQETTTEAKAPETTTEAKAPETTTEAKAQETTTEAKAPETTTEAKASETTTEAKAPTVKAPAKAPVVKAPVARAVKTCDMGPYITSIEINVLASDGNWYNLADKNVSIPEGVTFAKDAAIDGKIFYNPKDVQFEIGKVGDESTITYQIPKVREPQSGDVIGSGGAIAGEYYIGKDGHITIKLAPDYLELYDGYLENGRISFSGSLDSTGGDEDGNEKIVIGEDEITIPITPDESHERGVVHITKNVVKDGTYEIKKDDRGNYYIEYSITVETPTDNTLIMNNINVKDAFTTGGDLVDETYGNKGIYDIGIYDKDGKPRTDKGTFAYNDKTDKWEWTGIGNMDKGEKYTLTYKVRLDTSKLPQSGNDSNRVVGNRAEVFSGDELQNDATATATANSGLNIAKTTTGYNKEDGTVTYTVTVTAPRSNVWTIDPVTVEDIFSSNQEYVDDYVTITPSKGEIKNVGTADTDKKLNWEIGSMAPGEVQTLTYKVHVNDDIFLRGDGDPTDDTDAINRTITNTATLYYEGKKNETNADVNFKKNWLKKSGELQTEGPHKGAIKFLITANESYTVTGEDGKTITLPPNNLNYITFEDALTGDWVYDGDITVYKYNQGPANKGNAVEEITVTDSAGNKFDGKTSWEWTDKPAGPYYYEVVYYARLNDDAIENGGVGEPPISNGIDVGVGIGTGGGSKDYDHGANWEGSGADYDSLSKEFISRKGNIAAWQSKITCTVPEGAVYTDWKGEGQNWYFTDDQIAAIHIAQGKNKDDIKGELIDKTKYTVTRVPDTQDSFKIVFNETIKASEDKPLLINYNCTLDTSVDQVHEGDVGHYWNMAKLHINDRDDTAQDECTFTQEQLIKKRPGDYNSRTGLMTWKIDVNVTGTMTGKATVIDKLPKGLKFVSAEITNKGNEAGNPTMGEPTVGKPAEEESATVEEIVTMELDGLVATNNFEAFVTITLTTKVDEKLLIGNFENKKFTNTAILKYEGKPSKESSAEQTISNETLKKEGTYKAPDVTYKITINPDGRDMLEGEGNDTIRVEDTMSPHLMLREETLKITNSEGRDVTEEKLKNLKIDGNVFSFDVPDNEKLIVTYKAYVIGAVGSKPEVTNTVKYYGYKDTPGSKWKEHINIQESEAGIQGKPAIAIKKRDYLDTKLPLAGAEFTLYEVDKDGNEIELDTKETNDKGFAQFSKLDKTKVYAIHETKAPDGYYIDDNNSKKTYVAFSENETYKALKDKLEIGIYQGAITFTRYNKKAQITVKKEFANLNGVIPDGLYYFGLFDENKVLVEDQVKFIEIKNGDYLTENDKVLDSVTFENVNVGTDGKAKTYYVYETDIEGNIIPKNMDGTILVNGARFKVSGDGKVVVSEEDPDKIMEITNTEKPLKIAFVATKQLLNVADTTKLTFEFGLFNEEGKLIDTAHNDRDGRIAFKHIPYTRNDAGNTYTYTIKEIPDGKDGIIYDDAEYKVVVTVSHEKATGLTVSVKVNDSDSELKGHSNTSGVYEYVLPNKKDAIASFVNTFAGSAKLTKTDGDSKLLAGAEFELYRVEEEKEPELVKKFVTGEDGIVEAQDLAEGKYYFVETKAPVGYAIKMDKDGNPKHYSFEIGPNGGEQVVDYAREVKNEQIKFNVNKVELDGTKEVAGAELVVYGKDADGKFTVEIDKWVSKEGETHDFGSKLEAGNDYLLRETVAPEGYAYTVDIEFRVEADGTITTDAKKVVDKKTKEVTYLVEDKQIKFNVNKVELGSGKEVGGAELVVYGKDADGKYTVEIDKWVSKEGETHDFGSKLEAGKDYILRETVAPEGYAYAADIEFRVEADGTITTGAKKVVDEKTKEVTYLVEDDITRVTILKVDEEGNGVAGARLALKDATGKLITNEDGTLKYSWVTTGEPHPLGGIPAGNYILTELEAPEGYEVADDVAFTLDDAPGAVNEVVMVDKKTPETSKGSLTVTKKVELKGHEDVIINLDEATFYVALFSDEARTHRISNVKSIVFKNQQASEVVFENLAAGTYYVGETDAYGNLLENGYWKGVEFNPVYSDGYAAKLESDTFAAQVHFKNVFVEGPDGAFYEGEIDITKEVLKDGKAHKTDNVYYAGIFYDKEYTELLEKVELAMDGKSSTTVSVKVPLGTDPNAKVKFYVTEVDKNGKPLENGPKLKFKVTVKDGNVVMSVDEPKAEVKITNAYKTTTKAAKTGDDMNLWTTIALMIVSAAGVLMILFKRRKYAK